jgi:pyrroline-5-carboxylate reductase
MTQRMLVTISFKANSAAFVAEVTNVDLRRPLSESQFVEIHSAFERYAVLVFPGQPLTDHQQLAFSRWFGPLETAPNYAGSALRLRNEFTDISNLDHTGKILDPQDRLTAYNLGNQLWHTDSSFKRRRAKCSLLSAREVPPHGGETQYADMRAAYDALPDQRKIEIADLVAEHSIAHSRSRIGFDGFNDDTVTSLPPVPQRLIDHYPETGRTSLFLASHASDIIGWPRERGRALLDELIDFATHPQFVYTHRWAVGDLVVWDNRCTMHRGRPYDLTERRVLHRTTVSDALTSFHERASADQRLLASPVTVGVVMSDPQSPEALRQGQRAGSGRLIVVGCGHMGLAIVKGLRASALNRDVVVIDTNRERLNDIASFEDLRASATLEINPGDFVVLAIPPQAFTDFADTHRHQFTPDTAVLSVMAGLSSSAIGAALGSRQVVRSIPNTPSEVFQGMSVYFAGPDVTDETLADVEHLLQTIGKVLRVDTEELVNDATALCGGGPAFVSYIVDAFCQFAASRGFSEADSKEMAAQVFGGTASLIAGSTKTPMQLCQEVMTPNGTTERGIAAFDAFDLKKSVVAALAASAHRSRELAAVMTGIDPV